MVEVRSDVSDDDFTDKLKKKGKKTQLFLRPQKTPVECANCFLSKLNSQSQGLSKEDKNYYKKISNSVDRIFFLRLSRQDRELFRYMEGSRKRKRRSEKLGIFHSISHLVLTCR